jgi:hypothetical protein
MVDESKPGMQCTEFDALLTEAIDGTLRGQRREAFERHRAECAACSTLFAEVTSGVAWLDEMVDVVPPADLAQNILAATSGAAHAGVRDRRAIGRSVPAKPQRLTMGRPAVWERLRRELGVVFAPVLTPRFGMSMGMAFFSIMLVLDMAQIRIKDLTAHNLSHTFYSSENKVMKYYENTRLAYEIESRLRELRDAGGEGGGENRTLEKNNNQTERKSAPERREQREFSRDQKGMMLAKLSGSEQDFGAYQEANPEVDLGTKPEMVAKQRREL